MGFLNKLLGRNQASRPQAGVGAQVQPHHQTPQSPYHRGGTGVANGRTFTQQHTNNVVSAVRVDLVSTKEGLERMKNSKNEQMVTFSNDLTTIESLVYIDKRRFLIDLQKYNSEEGLTMLETNFQKNRNPIKLIFVKD